MDREGGLQLARVRIYPVKGAGGFDVESAEPDALGLSWDRRWMAVGPGGGFLSQRTHPRLALVRVAPEGAEGVFKLEAPGTQPLILAAGETSNDWMEVRVHDDTLRVPRTSSEAARWFSSFLGEACETVFFPSGVHRLVDPARAPGHRVGFADAYPLLLTTEESLEDLNRRATAPLSMLRFRPNLVVRGGRPWQEDRWRTLEIGRARIALVKPCARCSVTTVDPDSAVRATESLRLLGAFRAWGGKAFFGQNAVVTRVGSFRVGDGVHIVEEGEPRPPLAG